MAAARSFIGSATAKLSQTPLSTNQQAQMQKQL